VTPLPPFDASSRSVNAVIEAPRASRNKFKHVPGYDAFVLDRILPGSAFPIDFGFVPATLGDDGDPIDIMVFTEEPLVVGASCRRGSSASSKRDRRNGVRQFATIV
jgi:inorganic pyrophosphatase